jgi:predicted amidohydrolase YtcJ
MTWWSATPGFGRAIPRIRDSIAVKGDRIAAAGGVTASAKRVIDAGGRLVTPGFIDSHIHFLEGGFRLTQVQLRDARTRDEFVRRIGDYARKLPAGAWITGGDWDHSLWGGELPTRDWIDPVTPNHPVWVTRLDGHMGLANSAALAKARLTRDTADPDGGAIVRNAKSEPTGILKDNAMGRWAERSHRRAPPSRMMHSMRPCAMSPRKASPP